MEDYLTNAPTVSQEFLLNLHSFYFECLKKYFENIGAKNNYISSERFSTHCDDDRVPNGDGQHNDGLFGLWHIVLKYIFLGSSSMIITCNVFKFKAKGLDGKIRYKPVHSFWEGLNNMTL